MMDQNEKMSHIQCKEFLKDTMNEVNIEGETSLCDNVVLKRIDLINKQLKEKYGVED